MKTKRDDYEGFRKTVSMTEPDYDSEMEEEFVPDDNEQSVSGSDMESVLAHLREIMESEDTDLLDGENDDDDDDENKDNSKPDMTRDDYHNMAVFYGKIGNLKKALELCVDGLNHFNKDVDLLADAIKYATDAGEKELAEKYYSVIIGIPYSSWNWRAFQFIIDYLIDDKPVSDEDTCRSLIMEFKDRFPSEERAYLTESNFYDAIGDSYYANLTLENAVEGLTNASQCALILLDYYLKNGRYEDVIRVANYGIAASAKPQQDINVPYLLYTRALSMDYLIHKKVSDGKPVSPVEVENLRIEYDHIMSDFSKELKIYMRYIGIRRKLIKYIKVTE